MSSYNRYGGESAHLDCVKSLINSYNPEPQLLRYQKRIEKYRKIYDKYYRGKHTFKDTEEWNAIKERFLGKDWDYRLTQPAGGFFNYDPLHDYLTIYDWFGLEAVRLINSYYVDENWVIPKGIYLLLKYKDLPKGEAFMLSDKLSHLDKYSILDDIIRMKGLRDNDLDMKIIQQLKELANT